MSDPGLANLEKLYQDRFSPAEQAAKQRIWEVLCSDFFDHYIQPTDTVLDIACGYGEFINSVRCGKRIAVDLNTDARRHLRPDVRFLNQSCSKLDDIEDGSIDVAFESNLFEHLADKTELRRVVEEVHRKLRPGGRFIMLQPNIRYVGHAYWDFYDHLIPLTDVSCTELLRNCGFRIHTVIPRFIPYTTKSRLPQHPLLVKLYLKMRPVWPILGKQFVIVAEKAAEK
jgi:SAM-dependent methyltransferase